MALTLPLIVLLPFVASPFVPILARRFPRHAGWTILPVPAVIALYVLRRLPMVTAGEAESFSWPWAPAFGLDFSLRLDGFALLFGLLIAGIGTLVVAYSVSYLGSGEDLSRFYVCLLLFMGAMLGVVTSDNLLVLYMFWEITSVSSFLLIGFWHTRTESRQGALKAMLVTVMGGLALLAGILLLGRAGGSFSIRELAGRAPDIVSHPHYPAIVVLFLLGAFTKSAQVPFHLWLPGAMAAPTPVSAYLHSATMVKAGIFLAARMGAVLSGTDMWFYTITAAGLATMALGGFLAVQQRDLKALLAYSTVSQLGFIMTMFGYFTEAAVAAGVLHILNHGIFKGTLFMGVGIIDHETGTRRVDRLSGLARAMPVTAALMFLGAFSMAGVPLLNGFVSKEMVLEALLHPPVTANWFTTLLPVLAVAGSVFTTAYCLILTVKIFLGEPTTGAPKPPHEAPWPLLAPPAVLALFIVALGLRPQLVEGTIVQSAVASLLGRPAQVHLGLWHGVTPALGMSLAALGLGAFVYWQLPRLLPVLARVSGGRVNTNTVYEWLVSRLELTARAFTRRWMTGRVGDYFAYILVFAMGLIAIAAVRSGLPGRWAALAAVSPVSWLELVICLILMGGALLTAGAALRISMALGLATVGFAVAVLWFLWNAPDLALTQTIVETVSVIPLFLAFGFLPALRHRWTEAKVKRRNVAVAVLAGAVAAGVTWLAQGNRLFSSISHFYLENSYALGGGRNVVNVMIVDFRGFDTVFETVVFSLAAVAVYTLVAARREQGGVVMRQSPLLINPVIVPAISRVLFYMVLVFSLYLFFRGHNHPGGGFAAGVMAASAVVVWALAYERTAAMAMVPVHPRYIIGTGLLIIAVVGLAGVAVGKPFLTHAFVHFFVPRTGEVELASAALFDLGVAFAVFGAIHWLVAAMSDGIPLEQDHIKRIVEARAVSGKG